MRRDEVGSRAEEDLSRICLLTTPPDQRLEQLGADPTSRPTKVRTHEHLPERSLPLPMSSKAIVPTTCAPESATQKLPAPR